MAPSKELTALLFELERAGSPLDRLQVAARAWRSVRALDRRERQDLARRIGFDGAEELLERLVARGGLAPATLLEVIRRARRSDPAALDRLVAGLRAPGQRESAVLEGLRLAEELLEPASDDGDGLAPEGTGDDEPDAEEEDAPEPPPRPPLEAEATAAPHPPAQPPPAPPTPPASRPAPAPHPPASSRPTTTAPPHRSRPRPLPPPPPPSPPPSGTQVPVEPPPGETSRLGALRAVHRRLADAAGSHELEAAVAAVPDGWARRRAVLAALGHGRPTELADAVRLISSLDREHDRVWCLASLLSERPLQPEQLARALELVSSPSARDRLARLAARRRR